MSPDFIKTVEIPVWSPPANRDDANWLVLQWRKAMNRLSCWLRHVRASETGVETTGVHRVFR